MQVGDLVATSFSLKYYPNSVDLGIVVGVNPPPPFEDYYKYVEVQWNSGVKTTEKTEKLKVLGHG